MKQILKFALLVFSLILPAAAQFTVVTGTVVDPTGLPYASGQITPLLITTATPTLNGQAYTPPQQPTGLALNGSFTMRLADNTQLLPAGTKWNFQVCSAAGTSIPVVGKGSVCFTLAAPITISGSSQSISTQLNAVAPALTNLVIGTGSLTNVATGAGLTGGPCTTTCTVSLLAALPNGETATTQAPGDATGLVSTDAFVQAALAALGSPLVSGSGTVNRIPLFSGASVLANSVLSQTVGVLNVSGAPVLFGNVGTFITNTDTGAANAYATCPSGWTGLFVGAMAQFVSAHANTAASTLNVCATGVKSLTKNGATALIFGDIPLGGLVIAVYDGTEWQDATAATGSGSPSFSGLTLGAPVVASSTTSVVTSPLWIDATQEPGAPDGCLQINNALAQLSSTTGGIVDARAFLNPTACLTDAFAGRNRPGMLLLGSQTFVSQVSQITPISRFSILGIGPTTPGAGSVNNSVFPMACGPQVSGTGITWNSGPATCTVTNAVGTSTVSELGTAGGYSIVLPYAHPPFPADTYFCVLCIGGETSSSGTSTVSWASNSFGGWMSFFTVDAGGVPNTFNTFSGNFQEDAGFYHVTHRNCWNACFFGDRAIGGLSNSGPTHFVIDGGEWRASTLVSSPPPISAGYGIVVQANANQLSAAGGGCTTEPVAYPVINVAGIVSSAVLTYGGAGCSSPPTWTLNTTKGGSGATFSSTLSGGEVATLTVSTPGSGYSIGGSSGGCPFFIGNMTINGTSGGTCAAGANCMNDAVYIAGCSNANIGPIHTEWLSDVTVLAASVHLGDGTGLVSGGYIHGIDLSNAGYAGIHLGAGIDNNQIVQNFAGLTGNGKVQLRDDQNGSGTILPSDTPLTLTAPVWLHAGGAYTAGGTNIPTGYSLGVLQDAWANRSGVKTICAGNGTGTGSQSNIDCSGIWQGSEFLFTGGGNLQSVTGNTTQAVTAAAGLAAAANNTVVTMDGAGNAKSSGTLLSTPAFLGFIASCNSTFPVTAGTNTYEINPFQSAITSNSCLTLTTGTGISGRSPVTTVAGKCSIYVNGGANAGSTVTATLNEVGPTTPGTATATVAAGANNSGSTGANQTLAITAGDSYNVTITTNQAVETFSNPRVSVFCW